MLVFLEGEHERVGGVPVEVVDVEERLLHSWFVETDIVGAELSDEGVEVDVELSVVAVQVVNLTLGVVSPEVGGVRPWSEVFFLSPWVSQLKEGHSLTVVLLDVLHSEDVVGVVKNDSIGTELGVTASVGSSDGNKSVIDNSPCEMVFGRLRVRWIGRVLGSWHSS